MQPSATGRESKAQSALSTRPSLAAIVGVLLGVLTPFMFLLRFGGFRMNVSAGDALVATTAVVLLVRLYPYQEVRNMLRPLAWPLTLFFGWLALTSALSLVRYESVGLVAVRELLKYAADLVWLAVGVALLKSAMTRRAFLLTWLAMAVALSLAAVAFRLAAWPVPLRPELTFENPNALGFFLAASISVPWWVVRERRARYVWIATPVIFLGVLASGSRGATLGGAAAVGWMALTWLRSSGHLRWRQVVALILAGIVLVGALLATEPGRQVSESIVGDARLFKVDDRLEIWQDSWSLYQRSTWLGIGPGVFGIMRQAVLGRPPQIAHNEYLTALTEQGPVGLAALLTLLGSSLCLAWKYAPRHASAIVGGGVLVHSAVHGFVSNVFQMRLFWIGMALVLVAVWQASEGEAQPSNDIDRPSNTTHAGAST